MAPFKTHLQGGICNHCDMESGVPSLVEASCLQLTRNLNLTTHAVKIIPHSLYPMLLVGSLKNQLTVCTKAIVASWPFSTFSFRTLQRLSCIRCTFSKKQLPKTHNYTALAIAMAISDHRNTKIKDVDMTGLKLTEANEKAFLEILVKGRHTDEEPTTKKRRRKEDGKVDEGREDMRVVMDLTIRPTTAEQFCRLQHELDIVNISLRSKRLSVNGCGAPLLVRVLQSVDKTGTTDLDISFNRLGNSSLSEVLPHIQDFSSLTTLELDYNTINLRDNGGDTAVQSLKSTFENLTELRHLNMTGNRLTRRLSEVLSSLSRPLHGLDLSSCMLAAEDIAYLASSHHASHLQHLLLSNNRAVGLNWDVTERLLQKASGSLLELNLVNAGLDQVQADRPIGGRLAEMAKSFQCLRSLEIHYNCLSPDEHVDVVLEFVKRATMLELRLSLDTMCLIDKVDMYKDQRNIECLEDSPQTVVFWFILHCVRERKMSCDPTLGRRPMTVYIYSENNMSDMVTSEFQLT